MQKYAICLVDNRSIEYLVLFGYDGGSWKIEFSSGNLFCPVTFYDRHAAYNLINFIHTFRPQLFGSLYVEAVDVDG